MKPSSDARLRRPSAGKAKMQIGSDGVGTASLSALIQLIYRGTLETPPWASCLRELNRHLAASWSALVLRPAEPERPSLIIECHHDAVSVSNADYTLFERYSTDPFRDLPEERIVSPEEWLGSERWFESDFFRNYLAPLDIVHQIGADFHPDSYSDCRFRICRSRSGGPFSAADRQLCEWLVPHFKQAAYIHACLRHTEAERGLYANTLDRMQVGTAIVDQRGALLSINSTAERLLNEGDALIRDRDTLRARRPGDERMLRNALAEASQNTSASLRVVSVPRGEGRGELKLLIKALAPEPAAPISRPAAVIYIREPGSITAPSTSVLQLLFGFTPAESLLATLLAEGLSLDEASEKLGISKNTGKSRLRALFEKTHTRRQAALVRLLIDAIVWL